MIGENERVIRGVVRKKMKGSKAAAMDGIVV